MPTHSPSRPGRRKTAHPETPREIPVLHEPPVLQDAVDSLERSAAAGEDVSSTQLGSGLPDVKLHGETRPMEDREARIARAAYRRAEERGFYPGHEIDDWLAAEKEIAESDRG